LLKTQKLFQNGKSVLPGTAVLKHESGICVDIICGVAVIKSNHQSGDLSQPFFLFFCGYLLFAYEYLIISSMDD
jgi:hypothetical protein